MRIVKCLNCGTCFRGKYCPWCGQKASAQRLNWRTLLDNVVYSITNVERGIFRTVKDLFTRPGYMMRDYLAGKRVVYFKPFSMLVVLGGIYVILSTALTYMLGDVPDGMKVELGTQITKSLGEDYAKGFTGWLFNSLESAFGSPVFWSLFMIPFFALVARWIFRKQGARNYNYVEFLYICAYMACQRFLVDIVLLPYDLLATGDKPPLVVLAYVGLTAWDYKQFFGIKWRKSIWKSIRLFVEAFLIALLVSIIILIIIAAITVGLASLLEVFRENM